MARTAFAQRLRDIIAILIFSTELRDGFIAGVDHVINEIADAVAVHRITKLRFRRDFIALSHSHVPHVVIEPGKIRTLPSIPYTSTHIPLYSSLLYIPHTPS